MLNDIKIIVATHKRSAMPKADIYLPLHVGAAGKYNDDGSPVDFGYARDDSGENISDKNSNFGTQTGLFWAWKNLDAEYKGLVHYRRYFVGRKKNKNDMIASVISYDELKPMLERYKIFVPKKRRYYIETLYSHYAHTHDGKHFDIVREIIQKDCPEYLRAFDKVLRRRWGYMFNMMILQKDLMDDYCEWLFNILFQAYERIDKTNLSAFDSRFCGRISEILFDVWIERKLEEGTVSKGQIKELPYMEDVNWKYKIKVFLSAKFLNKKYGASS
ncbi:MAG: DUF4422 domain-containing protein [Lachnospiraceae bacterium]|nr:DUF4422 domain-containing protein [Lachnospiraceae bacterium]